MWNKNRSWHGIIENWFGKISLGFFLIISFLGPEFFLFLYKFFSLTCIQNVDFIMGFSYIVFLDSVLSRPLAQFPPIGCLPLPIRPFLLSCFLYFATLYFILFYSFSILALCSFIAALISIKLKLRLQYERKHVVFGFLGLGYFAWCSNFKFHLFFADVMVSIFFIAK